MSNQDVTYNVMRCFKDKPRRLKMFFRIDRHESNRLKKQGHDTEEPLDDLTTGYLAEGRVRYGLCNQILRAAASADPNACDSSLSIEVHKTSLFAPRPHRQQGVSVKRVAKSPAKDESKNQQDPEEKPFKAGSKLNEAAQCGPQDLQELTA